MALTYSLLGPVMTVARPVGAFFTALCAGTVENLISWHRGEHLTPPKPAVCCLQRDDSQEESNRAPRTLRERLGSGVLFALNDLMDDLTGWLLLGVLLAGTITAFIPESLVGGFLGSGLTSYLVILAVSLPMYVCASASTPIAAALIAKGMSPGAALVFLMAGPATNVATMTMVGAMLGMRTLGVYIGSIVLCVLGMAYGIDFLHHWLGFSIRTALDPSNGEFFPHWLEIAAAVLLALLMARVLVKKVRDWRASMLAAGSSKPRPDPPCRCIAPETGVT